MIHQQNRLVSHSTTMEAGEAQDDWYWYVEHLMLKLGVRAIVDPEINLRHAAGRAAIDRCDAIRSLEHLQQLLTSAGTELRLRPIGDTAVEMRQLPALADFLRSLLHPVAIEWARLRPLRLTKHVVSGASLDANAGTVTPDVTVDSLPLSPEETGGGILAHPAVQLQQEATTEEAFSAAVEFDSATRLSAPIKARNLLNSFEEVMEGVNLEQGQHSQFERLTSQLHELLDDLVVPTSEATQVTRALVQAIDDALRPAGITHESQPRFVYTYAGKLQEMIGLIQTRQSRGGSLDESRARRVRKRLKPA